MCVLGMGYVGCVTAACLAENGHTVVGVDLSAVKLETLRQGRSPVDEPGLEMVIRAGVQSGRLRVTHDVSAAVHNSELSLVCVGTPSTDAGGLDLSQVLRVCEQVGRALSERAPGHVVVVRSTMLPGSMASVVSPALEKYSARKAGEHFHTVFNPEFLREGTSLKDYQNPPIIVIGTESETAAELMRQLYGHLQAPFIVTSTGVAEMVKYTSNAWHAVKITFANEIGEICRAAQVDSHAVMDIFMQDCQLNISRAYLRPGFAFGGSCLPKDLRALTYFARHHDLSLPMLEHVNASNQVLIERVFQRILTSGVRRVGLYGLSFKPKTDDLRESPFVNLAEHLIGKGIKIRIFDESIQPEKLTGTNKAYIEKHLPHLVQYLVKSIEEFDGFTELVVVGHKSRQVGAWLSNRDRRIKILDLVGLDRDSGSDNYEGMF